MILPLGTDRSLKRPTLVNHVLLGVNVALFVAGLLLESRAAGPESRHAFEALLLHPRSPHWWQFVTYQFLHDGPLHIAGNMLFLWTFGPNVEDRLGRLGYLAFYLLGGVAAGAMHCLMSVHPVLGASGSIAAVTGAYFVLFPRTLIRVFIIFFFIGVYQIPAGWFIGASVLWDLAMHGRHSDDQVAVAAHVGGYAFGVGVSFALLATGLLKREQFDLVSLAKHAKRRREFKALTASGKAAWAHEASPGVLAANGAPPDPAVEAQMRRRAEITAAVATGDVPAVASAYRALLSSGGRTTLARAPQLDLANLLFAGGERDLAAEAYSIFLDTLPRDPEAPRVRLMLGLIHARYLNDPIRAKALLAEAKPALTTADQRALADEILAELG